jgi:hypothetical protein
MVPARNHLRRRVLPGLDSRGMSMRASICISLARSRALIRLSSASSNTRLPPSFSVRLPGTDTGPRFFPMHAHGPGP